MAFRPNAISPPIIRKLTSDRLVQWAFRFAKELRDKLNLSERFIRPRVFNRNVWLVAGPEVVEYDVDEVIVLCVVRNGALHIRSFIEHHFGQGVRHIVFLDNGSTDETVRMAAGYPNVTILQTTVPYRTYETVMKRYLVRRFAQNRWSLFVDIDERFDYPYSDLLSLRSLLTYLNEHSYTAVVAQMLDMFSDNHTAEAHLRTEKSIREVYSYYDISNIEKTDYPYGILSNYSVKMHWGGIRRTLFNTRNGLTKAALIFLDEEVEPFVDWHHARRARLADFTCLLLHYPFAGSFYEKVADAVEMGRYGGVTTREYRKYWQMLKQTPALTMKRNTACKLESVNTLVHEGFLVVSELYQQWTRLTD